MPDLTSTASEKIFLQWVLSKVLNQISKDLEAEKSKVQSMREHGSTTSLGTDHHLLEVFQELLLEQDLR